MESKLIQLINALKADDTKTALKISRKFWFGLTKEEKKTISRAYEASFTNPEFFKALGYNADQECFAAIAILKAKYLPLDPSLKSPAVQNPL